VLKRQRAAVKAWSKIDVRDRMYDHELKQKLPPDIGVGFEYTEEDGTRMISCVDEDPREVRLEVTSFRGVSPGAVHYYGKLEFYRAWFRKLDAPDDGTVSICGRSDDLIPPQVKFGCIELTRALTQHDLTDRYLRDRFKNYKVGERQYTFNEITQVIRRARFVFRKWFLPGWKYIEGEWEEC